MRISTKGRFAVTAMMEVALRERHGPVSLAGISERQNMSLSYLEQLFSRLRRYELVQSTRGPGGGYTLGRRLEAITVADIVVAVDSGDDKVADRPSMSASTADDGACLADELWETLNARMIDFMDTITLRDLVDKELAKRGGRVTSTLAAEKDRTQKARLGPRLMGPNSVFAFGRLFA